MKRSFLLLLICLTNLAVPPAGFYTLSAQPADLQKSMASLSGLSNALEAVSNYVGRAVVQVFTVGYAAGDAQTAASIISMQRNSGSGVLLDPSGYIITNAHVVEGAERVQVLLAQRETDAGSGRSILKLRGPKIDGEIIGIDRETDLALLKIDARNLPYLTFGDSDLLRQGQVVLAFGSPLGLENSVSMGIISSIARQLEPEDPMVYIQTDAPINPGNSGGALVAANGKVIGINTFIFSQSGGSEGLGFAVPSNIVQNVYRQLKATGRVRRGVIGVHAQTISPEMAAALNLPRDWGVILGDVFPGSPAAEAGLKAGDIVLGLDGKTMENGRQFDVNLYQRSIGERVTLKVLREGAPLTATVTVLERSDDPDRFMNMVNPRENLVPRLGILAIDINRRIEEMLPRLRKRFGVLVAAISEDSPVGTGRFYPGDVIYSINNNEITGLKALREQLTSLKTGDVLVAHIQRYGRLMYVTLVLDK